MEDRLADPIVGRDSAKVRSASASRVLCLALTLGAELGAPRLGHAGPMAGMGGVSPGSDFIDRNLRVEPAAAGFLSAAQLRTFGAGGGVSVRGALTPLPFLDVHVVAGMIAFAAKDNNPNDSPGLSWQLGGGLRIKRPWTAGFVSPWLDLDLTYVQTGDLSRFGFSVGAGAGFAVNAERGVRVGPFLRYSQIVTPSGGKLDTTDAKMMLGGVSVEYGRHVDVPPKGAR